jgi:hypothetical protein
LLPPEQRSAFAIKPEKLSERSEFLSGRADALAGSNSFSSTVPINCILLGGTRRREEQKAND